MEFALSLFVFIPFIGFLVSLLISEKKESLISKITFCTAGAQYLLSVAYIAVWFYHGRPVINIKEFVVYQTAGYEFFIDLYFDIITAVFLLVGAFLTFLINVYSRYYLHREDGYKRFFNTILFFFLGYNIIILSGNFETMFIGWEVLGISSFLLIGFYRNRYLPVRNAFKVFSIYRVADVCMILAMWMSHHLWHHNVTFLELNNYSLVDTEVQSHVLMSFFIFAMLLIAACVKSAMIPFSSWLPRAMEGPTPSSAIFYSSLSVHIGVFLLLRTFPFWEHQLSFRVIVGVVGLTTSIIATWTGQVQSSIKSQIAYTSIAQIGLIFIEIALGLEIIALIHFAGNAFLRTYQLLVSPSVVTYLIREQFYNFQSEEFKPKGGLMAKLQNSIYVLSIKEWNLDTYMFRFLWNPAKRFGRTLLRYKASTWIILFSSLSVWAFVLMFYQQLLPAALRYYLPIIYALIGLLSVLIAFTARQHVMIIWYLSTSNHFWIAIAIYFNDSFTSSHILIYLSGVIVSSLLGLYILYALQKKRQIDLCIFHGYIKKHRREAFLFLVACLGIAGFPISTTFIGEDLIYSHIHHDQYMLTLMVSLGLILNGLVVIRLYSRIFLGPAAKGSHDATAYRSS